MSLGNKHYIKKLLAVPLSLATLFGAFTALYHLAPDKIQADTDAKIQAACPKISPVQLATIFYPKDLLPIHKKRLIIPERIWGELSEREKREKEAQDSINKFFGIETPPDPKNETIAALAHKIKTASPGQPIIMEVNSNGGRVDLGNLIIDAMQQNQSPEETFVTDNAASMATGILFSGTKRWSFNTASMMIHATREGGNGVSTFYEHHFPEGSKEHRFAKQQNIKTRNKLVLNSRNNTVDHNCSLSLIRGMDDINVSPSFALKANWIDSVINVDENGRYNGTITIRAKDPRFQNMLKTASLL